MNYYSLRIKCSIKSILKWQSYVILDNSFVQDAYAFHEEFKRDFMGFTTLLYVHTTLKMN